MNLQNFSITSTSQSPESGSIVISPLPRGFGQSLGNALRRTLLSSIEGYAVTYVKINDVVHPFSTIAGVRESVLEIILNIKKIRFAGKGEGPFVMNIKKKGSTGNSTNVTAGDFVGACTVKNPELVLAQLSDSKANLDIEITVEKGLGFSSRGEKESKGYGILAVDSVFSPVERVSFLVEEERVGRSNNFDRLTLNIWTDASITVLEAYNSAVATLTQIMAAMSTVPVLTDMENKSSSKEVGSEVESKPKKKTKGDKSNDTIIDELDLPTRVINALLREEIETVGDLISRGREELVNMKGVGRKSVDLIDSELQKLGLSLG